MQFLRNGIQNLNLQRAMSFYAVARGHTIGIFDSWSKCEEQVKGFRGARYKKFQNFDEAEKFVKEFGNPIKLMSTISNSQYAPESAAVSLGKRVRGSWEQGDGSLSKSSPFKYITQKDDWKKSSADASNNGLSDAELVGATVAAEKSTTTVRKPIKRKIPDSATLNASKMPRYISKVWEPHGLLRIGDHDFQTDIENYVIVYTDGSCINNGRQDAAAGYGVYFGEKHALNAAEPIRGRATNNVGEIQAAIHAIKMAKQAGIKKLCISTDSQFLINAITSWIHGWKTNNWRLKDGKPVKNLVDFKVLSTLIEEGSVDVKWNYVKAHQGINGNEMADKLAREGSEKYKRLNTKRKFFDLN